MTQQHHQIETSIADLKQYPSSFKDHHQQIITIGDLHGNTMKLVWLLCHFSVIRFREPVANFKRLWEIYETPVDALTIDMVTEFETIIQSSQFVEERPKKIIFIGDTLADRGHNDYFTLIVFQRIFQHIEYIILLSNHDLVHLCEAEGNHYLEEYPPETHENYFISFLNFQKLLAKFPVLQESAIEMRNTSFKPFVKMFEFGFPNDKTMLLFSHTPFIFNEYFFKTDLLTHPHLNELFVELEQINIKVSEHIAKNELHLLSSAMFLAAEHREFAKTKDNAFLIQNDIINIHGHVGQRHNHLLLSQSVNLDTDLGRTKTSITPEIYQGEFSYYCHQTELQHQQQKLLTSSDSLPTDELNYEYISKILEHISQLDEWSSLDENSPQMVKLLHDLSEHSKLAELYQLVTILDDFGLLNQYLEEAINCQEPVHVFKIIYLLIEEIESEEYIVNIDMTNLFRHQDPKTILNIFLKLLNHGFLTEELENISQLFEHPNLMMMENIIDTYLHHKLLSDHELLNHLFQKSTKDNFLNINKILFKKGCLNNDQKLFVHLVLCAEERNLLVTCEHLFNMYKKNLISNQLINLITSLDFFNMPRLSLLIQLIPDHQQAKAVFAFKHIYPIFEREQLNLSRFQSDNVNMNTFSDEDWATIEKKPEHILIVLEQNFVKKSKSSFENHFFTDTQAENTDPTSMKKPKLKRAEQSESYEMQKNSM